jgi:MFS family permease
MTTITTTQTTQPSGPAHGTMRAALAYPHFRRLLGALAVSQAGDWLYNLALLALVFSRTHSPAWLSVTTAARVLPVVVLGPIGGVLADRYNRKRLMVASDILRVGFMLALAAVAALGLPVLLAPMLAAATTAVGSVYPSCVAAATPGLVPDADLPGANALRSAVNATCVIVGPGLGAALLLVGSPAIAIAINAVTFAVSAGLVAALPGGEYFQPERRPETERPSALAEITEGVKALRAEPIAVRLVGADIVSSTVYGVLTVLLLLVARRLGDSAEGYGLMLAGLGLGGVIATPLSTRLARIDRSGLVVGGALVAVGAPMFVLATTHHIAVAIGAVVVTGIGSVLVEVLADTALQRQLPPAVLGRAYGFAFPASIAGIVVGSLVASPLLALLGTTGTLVVTGALVTAYAAVVAGAGRRLAAPVKALVSWA